ncbi:MULTISPECIES: TonB-dependent siderophore receptor [unclassified Duganella]|uniref:TonB-dependent receptor plug domain-containing protein n=1 Tax=unclassified Duganella TaxID=2636909 RepID=UPI00088B76A5|nr:MULTISPECIES: TonB-dependent receptor [unclassified Duganella]SDG68085.1 iron complex outermembrane recepter protein [Duganella sp. OV458]SDJ93362.1 iron complex outermembrane recepter protein [Duganella sp. OV510]
MKSQQSVMNRSAQPRLLLSAISLAVMALTNQASAQSDDANMTRVEVTGSSIKRVANEASLPVTSVKAEDMVKQGMTTLADFMMALPQSASLAPSNAGSGTNINLRGLGVNRTLVLLNGRRLANEAIADGYANLDVIPMSAIARVEVLRDGASSIYGSDAIGGVVNFITKTQFEGLQLTAQAVQPEKKGGGDEQRLTATWGKGNLQTDGWNVYATVDAHQRTRLNASDRAYLSSAEKLTELGRAPSLGTGGNATPANFTTPTNKTAQNPYGRTGCLAPYSIAGQNGTCVIDNNEYGTALYANQQVTFYARGSLKLSEDHIVSIDYSRGEEFIKATRNPTNALAVKGVAPTISSTSKWYPGGSGGVPAVAGLNNAPLTVTWAVADLGAATTKDVQLNQRIAVTDEGIIGGWDYKAGLVVGISERDNYYYSGYVTGQGLIDGLKNGKLNPFGLQDTDGKAYLASISVDGAKNRTSKSTFTGVDFTASKALMELPGGSLALAVGADLHRDTTEDTKLAIVSDVTYANTSPSHGEGQRNVAALFAEINAPITKTLELNGAVRADHFNDFGTTVNPKLSFRWEPMKQLMFRGSANTGFRAPTLFDAYGYRLPGATGLTAAKWDDPVLCPGGTPGVAGTGKPIAGQVAANVCNVQLPKQTGSNAGLRPEKSKGFTLGVVMEPFKDATLSLDYWNIRMTDMLANLPEQVYFLDPAKYAAYFVRNTDGTINYINNTTMNLGGQKAGGIDVSGSYTFPKTSFGTFRVNLDGTYLTQFDNQLFDGSPFVSNIGQFGLASNGTTSSFPIITYRWKHTLRLNWASGNWNSTLTQNYNSKYTDQNLVAKQYWRDINSYKLWNLTTTYSGFKNIQITAGITNLFNAEPPATNSSLYSFGYLSSAASPIGRAYNVRATYTF